MDLAGLDWIVLFLTAAAALTWLFLQSRSLDSGEERGELFAASDRLLLRSPRLRDLLRIDELHDVANLRPNGLLDRHDQPVNVSDPAETIVSMVVVERATDSVVGIVGFRTVVRDHESASNALEFSILIRSDLHGTGIGSEATALSIERMLNAGCERVIAGCDIENRSMRSILQRLAGESYHQGSLRLPNGSFVDSIWFEFTDPSRLTNAPLRDRSH